VWMLLQPRGHLGGYFLYAALAAGAIGLVLAGATAEYPAFRGMTVLEVAGKPTPGGINTVFPALFIMIACGACSGFHSLIASGTTSKQLKSETDAKSIGYGAMLLEAMVAIVSLCCVMMFAEGSPQLNPSQPNMVYAHGIGRFLEVVQVDRGFGIAFALMAFTTFVYDTLDVCTRLGRYILQELTGLHNWGGKIFGTAATAGVPLFFLLRHPSTEATPVWRIFWNLFGASNQLLAALTLLGVTVWLWQTRKAWWVWLVTGLPTVWMYAMSMWALYALTWPKFYSDGKFKMPTDPVPWAGVVLIALAIVMLFEAVRILLSLGRPPAPKHERTVTAPMTQPVG
jgi:carbon starvation protein